MRYNKTRKKIKGGFLWFGNKKKVTYSGNNEDIKNKIEKINESPDPKYIYKELKDPSKIQNKVVTLESLSTVGTVGSTAIAVVGSTGIGLPVAGLMALVLLLTNKMIGIYRLNLLLQLLMQDATFIIMDCYLLYDLIEKSYEILNKYVDPTSQCSNSNTENTENTSKDNTNALNFKIQKFQINRIMQQQLKYQIEKLIKELLSLTDKETILELEKDITLQGEAIRAIIKTEADKRKNESKYGLGRINRSISKKFYGSYYITNINNSLTIINSYIILLKSNLDLTIKKFEILKNDEYIDIWKKILCTPEYNSYIKPILSEVLKDAGNDAGNIDPENLKNELNKVELNPINNSDTNSDTNTNPNPNIISQGGYKLKRRTLKNNKNT